jgi:hypothetical protein
MHQGESCKVDAGNCIRSIDVNFRADSKLTASNAMRYAPYLDCKYGHPGALLATAPAQTMDERTESEVPE